MRRIPATYVDWRGGDEPPPPDAQTTILAVYGGGARAHFRIYVRERQESNYHFVGTLESSRVTTVSLNNFLSWHFWSVQVTTPPGAVIASAPPCDRVMLNLIQHYGTSVLRDISGAVQIHFLRWQAMPTFRVELYFDPCVAVGWPKLREIDPELRQNSYLGVPMLVTWKSCHSQSLDRVIADVELLRLTQYQRWERINAALEPYKETRE